MGWTNAGVKQMFDTYGDRICYISLNNGKGMFIGYRMQDGVQLKDIRLETIGGNDVMIVKHRSNKQQPYIEWEDFITTEFIENIEVMGEAYKDYRVDPLLLKA